MLSDPSWPFGTKECTAQMELAFALGPLSRLVEKINGRVRYISVCAMKMKITQSLLHLEL